MKVIIPIMVLIVVVDAFVLYGFLLYHGNPHGLDDVILGRILGTADMALGAVLQYCFGTTASSKLKDETIQALSGKQ